MPKNNSAYTKTYSHLSDVFVSDLKSMIQPNPYSNKNLSLNGNIGYVTNSGVYKWYPNVDTFNNTAGNNGCPNTNTIINKPLTIDNYNQTGTQIKQISPNLVVGTKMQSGQSCGNEGSNVFVTSILNNPKSTYLGCFADATEKLLTYFDSTPSVKNLIVNGNFETPVLSNNSFKYISDNSTITGWNTNAVLLNNSGQWDIKTPYPYGNQCIVLQKAQNISQYINLIPDNQYFVKFFSIGRDCCDSSNLANTINVTLDNSVIYSFTPDLNNWNQYSFKFTAPNNNNNNTPTNMLISFLGTSLDVDRSSALQNITISSTSTSSDYGNYSYQDCMNLAITKGFKYFALQDVNEQTNKGYCGLTNDPIMAQSEGNAYKNTNQTILWQPNITSESITSALKLNNQGCLILLDDLGNILFSTPNTNAPNNYLGCYFNPSDSNASNITLLGKNYTYESCKNEAQNKKYTMFGLGDIQTDNTSSCYVSNDSMFVSGKSQNCKIIDDINFGIGLSNAVYKSDGNTSDYYLVLTDDGNMSIYIGTSPSNSQGLIWSTNTTVNIDAIGNKDKVASKGKYGRNWMKVNETLGKGDFIGSPNGKIYLSLDSNGIVQLLSTTMVSSCNKLNVTDSSTSDIYGGETNANALYSLESVGNKNYLGKMGYVTQDAKIKIYPSNVLEFTKDSDFMTYSNNDVDGEVLTSGIVNSEQDCKNMCLTNTDSNMYTFDKTSGMCLVKKNDNYVKNVKDGVNMGIKIPKVKGKCGNVKTSIIDSDMFSKYPFDGEMSNNANMNVCGMDVRDTKSYVKYNKMALNVDKHNDILKREIKQIGSKNENINKQILERMTTIVGSYEERRKNHEMPKDEKTYKEISQIEQINRINHESELYMESERMKLILWGILAVGAIGVGTYFVRRKMRGE